MKYNKKYTCYNSKGVKLGIIELKSNSDDLRKVFLDNKEVIKQAFPGTAFIKHKSLIRRSSD